MKENTVHCKRNQLTKAWKNSRIFVLEVGMCMNHSVWLKAYDLAPGAPRQHFNPISWLFLLWGGRLQWCKGPLSVSVHITVTLGVYCLCGARDVNTQVLPFHSCLGAQSNLRVSSWTCLTFLHCTQFSIKGSGQGGEVSQTSGFEFEPRNFLAIDHSCISSPPLATPSLSVGNSNTPPCLLTHGKLLCFVSQLAFPCFSLSREGTNHASSLRRQMSWL